MTNPTNSDEPGGDLTEHGADPAARQQAAPDHAETDERLPHEDGAPAGDLTEHGVDPAAREQDESRP